jgi:chaperonin GroES
MAAKVRPLGDKILLKRVEAESKTKSGIVLPETAKEKPKRGTVIAIGDGKLLDSGERAKFQVKKGDEVIFASYAGTEIKVGDDVECEADIDALFRTHQHRCRPPARQIHGLVSILKVTRMNGVYFSFNSFPILGFGAGCFGVLSSSYRDSRDS